MVKRKRYRFRQGDVIDVEEFQMACMEVLEQGGQREPNRQRNR